MYERCCGELLVYLSLYLISLTPLAAPYIKYGSDTMGIDTDTQDMTVTFYGTFYTSFELSGLFIEGFLYGKINVFSTISTAPPYRL